jgi:hypothetical protein
LWLVRLTYFLQLFIPEMVLPASLSIIYSPAIYSMCGYRAPAAQRLQKPGKIWSPTLGPSSPAEKTDICTIMQIWCALPLCVCVCVCLLLSKGEAQGWINPGSLRGGGGSNVSCNIFLERRSHRVSSVISLALFFPFVYLLAYYSCPGSYIYKGAYNVF